MSKHENTLYACLTKQPTHQHIVETHGDGDFTNIHIARAAFLNGVEWPQHSTIKIAFIKQPFTFEDKKYNDSGYTPEKAAWVQKVIEKNITPLVNLIFVWDVSLQESDVRISFVTALGSFSFLGIQAKQEPKDSITMNLGWTDQDKSSSDEPIYIGTGVNIVHEFGHFLGMIHEHSRADADLQWNKPIVYQTLGGPPNNWSKTMCNQQIFKQYALSSFNGSKYDPHSVMHYIFPSKFFKVDPNLIPAKHLSDLDIVWINKKYPGKPLPPGILDLGESVEGSSWLHKYWILTVLLGVVSLGIVIGILLKRIRL